MKPTNVAVSLRRDEPLSFRQQDKMQAALCERLAKVYGPDGGMRSVDLVV